MPTFSQSSLVELGECHADLQKVLNKAIEVIDFKILEGHRGEAAQNEAFRLGFSKLKFPKGKHNSLPSRAVDIAPYPINWQDTDRFIFFVGIIIGIGKMMGVELRSGFDWDRDTQITNDPQDTFRDWGHVELVDP